MAFATLSQSCFSLLFLYSTLACFSRPYFHRIHERGIDDADYSLGIGGMYKENNIPPHDDFLFFKEAKCANTPHYKLDAPVRLIHFATWYTVLKHAAKKKMYYLIKDVWVKTNILKLF